jgi:colanic acid/amylovoran biosynthesis protein
LIDLAGVSFIDGREKFLPFNILTILPAMLLGVPVVKFAQAMGPSRIRSIGWRLGRF